MRCHVEPLHDAAFFVMPIPLTQHSAGDPDFFEHSLRNTPFLSLSGPQNWAAKQFGWTEDSWNAKSFTPGNFNNATIFPITLEKIDELNLNHYLGRKKKMRPAKTETSVHLSSHFVATRILRYSVVTYARLI